MRSPIKQAKWRTMLVRAGGLAAGLQEKQKESLRRKRRSNGGNHRVTSGRELAGHRAKGQHIWSQWKKGQRRSVGQQVALRASLVERTLVTRRVAHRLNEQSLERRRVLRTARRIAWFEKQLLDSAGGGAGLLHNITDTAALEEWCASDPRRLRGGGALEHNCGCRGKNGGVIGT